MHCAYCDEERIFHRRSIDHKTHFILTVLTLGLWSVSWLAAAIGKRLEPLSCTSCHWYQKPNGRRVR
jgi:hypothetical protein